MLLRATIRDNKTMTIRLAAASLLILIVAAFVPTAASAQQPAYVGRWAPKPAQCKIPQGNEDAPLVMRRDGYDQFETHCRFSNIRQKGQSWTVRAACEAEGDKQTMTLTLSVANNRLTIRDEFGPRVLQRCR
jgi:hypothetical protein